MLALLVKVRRCSGRNATFRLWKIRNRIANPQYSAQTTLSRRFGKRSASAKLTLSKNTVFAMRVW